ncbi:MAG: EamA family transporter [bacterium]
MATSRRDVVNYKGVVRSNHWYGRGKKMAERKTGGHWPVLLAAVLWGTSGTTQTFAPAGATPLAIGTARMFLGGASLLVIALLRGSFQKGGKWPLWETLLASLSMAAFQPFFFTGVSWAGVAVGTVVAIGSSPILAGLLGYFLRGERPDRRWALATLLAVTGCGLLFIPGSGGGVNPWGVLLALGAGLSFALYVVTNKTLLENHSPAAANALVFCFGALLLSPLLFFVDFSWLADSRGIAVVLHLGLVVTTVAYLLFSWGLERLPAATAVTLSLAEPLTAALLGVVVVGESLTLLAALGVALLLAGLFIMSWNPGAQKGRAADPGPVS